jgi:GNAT superfamily N-acetyltransferase
VRLHPGSRPRTDQGGVVIRPRTDADLDELLRLLLEQQPSTGYPEGWPESWPDSWPLIDFIRRDTEYSAFVAEVGRRLVGHVSVLRPSAPVLGGTADDPETHWMAAHGRPLEELAVVACLFVADEQRGRGVGGALLDAAVADVTARGLGACLDAVNGRSPAVSVYLHRGWELVAECRPYWATTAAPVVAMVWRPSEGSDGPTPGFTAS